MNKRPVSLEFDAIKLANHNGELKGEIAMNDLPRLKAIALNPEEMVHYHLQFGKDDARKRIINVQIEVKITLECQVCTEPVTLSQQSNSVLGILLSDGQSASLSKAYEPYVTHGEPSSLVELLEDEVLLALPMIPKHEHKCLK